MIDALSVNKVLVKSAGDNKVVSDPKLNQNETLTETEYENSTFEDTIEESIDEQLSKEDWSNRNKALATDNIKEAFASFNEELSLDELSNEQLISDQFTNTTNSQQSILQQAQMLSIAQQGSLTSDNQAQLNLNTDVFEQLSSTLSSNLGSNLSANLNGSLSSDLLGVDLALSQDQSLAIDTIKGLFETQQPITVDTIKEILADSKSKLTDVQVNFQATQSSTVLNISQTSMLNTLTPTMNELGQSSVKTFNQFNNSQSQSIQSLESSSLPTDFSFIDENTTDPLNVTRFSSYNSDLYSNAIFSNEKFSNANFTATDMSNIANWQSEPVMTEVTDVPIMQVTTSVSSKSTIDHTSLPSMTYGASSSIEQQRTHQLQQMISTGNYTEVTVKDSKLGDIHFSVSGEQKEHLGVLAIQSQTQAVIQTHLVEIQQELADEGVSDFEMFSSKEEQEKQKREYLAQQAKSFSQNEEELLESNQPSIQATIISSYSSSSINITA